MTEYTRTQSKNTVPLQCEVLLIKSIAMDVKTQDIKQLDNYTLKDINGRTLTATFTFSAMSLKSNGVVNQQLHSSES